MSIQEEYELRAIRKKFAKACQEIGSVTKSQTADTGKYKYSYTTLTEVLRAVKEVLGDQGLSLAQPVGVRDGFLVVDVLITDVESGQYLIFPGMAHQIERDPQAMGSAITYGRRYTLMSLFGIETEDDDGQEAHRRAVNPGQRTGAEREIRALIEEMDEAQRGRFQAAFVEKWSVKLTDLSESRHGAALSWTKDWLAEEEADQGWRVDAQGGDDAVRSGDVPQ